MQLKKKNRTMIFLLVLMLATSGCRSKDEVVDIKEGYEDILDDYLDNGNFYDGFTKYDINKDDYKPFYYTYLSSAIANMTDEEYADIIHDIVDIEYNLDVINLEIKNMLRSYGDGFGHGFYTIVLNQLGESSTAPMRFVNNEVYSEVNTLRSIVNNDEEFYDSLFSRDINNVIDCIWRNTKYPDRTLIEDLVLNFDQYKKVTIYDDASYQEQMLASTYAKRIREIMSILVQYKCEHDEAFSQTLYGNLLMNSTYYGNDSVHIYQELYGLNGSYVDTSNPSFPYYITIPSSDLFSNRSIEDVKEDILEYKMSNMYEEETYDLEKSFMEFLVLLPDMNTLDGMRDPITSKIRSLIYENLKEYFKSEDEFNSFVLSLSNNSSEAQNYYFQLFIKKLKNKKIDYTDFVRYMSLANYIADNTFARYDVDYYYDVPYEEILNMPEEEYSEYIPHHYYLSFLFENKDVDYFGYLEQMREILKNNDLGYEITYNPNCYINWEYGRLYPKAGNTKIVSSLVEPKKMNYAGSSIIYYEYPGYYEDGEVVETFINYNGEYTLRTIPGFKEEIIDPHTNDVKTIYIVSINGNLEDFKPAHFTTYYLYYNLKQEEEKKYTYGGSYE